METAYIQLAKPLLSEREIDLFIENNIYLRGDLRNHLAKTRESFLLLLALVKQLKLPVRVLQQTCYIYQRFYLLTNNYRKYSNGQTDVAITSLFIALKSNDFIVKLSNVLQEANAIRKINVDVEEQKKGVMCLEKKMMELQSFDFRSYVVEDVLIRFLKFYQGQLSNDILYLAWCVLNDLYFTKLVLIYPAHYNALIALNCAILIHNDLQKDDKSVNFKDLKFNFDQKELNNGCNIMLEYYIDNINATFLKDGLVEVNEYSIIDQSPSQGSPSTPSTPGNKYKKLQDSLINIKIDLNSNLPASLPNIKETLKLDQFFQQRDTDLSKTGSVRFLYNRQKYTNEVLYKKS